MNTYIVSYKNRAVKARVDDTYSGEDLYIIQTTDNWGNLEVIEDAAIVSAAKDSQGHYED